MIDEDTVAPLERMAYSVPEAAKVCGLSDATMYRAARSGKIQFKKIGNRTFVTREELSRFLAEAPNR